MLPHKVYQADEFKKEGEKLRQRFQVGDEFTIFPTSDPQNVPIDGLPRFIESIWTCIRERKELNLPGEKQMVATYRCNEIKQEAIEKVEEELRNLEQLSNSDIIPNFQDRCKEVLKIAFFHYDDSAVQYYKLTYEKIRLELTSEIMKKLTKCYENQINNQRIECEKKFDKGMKNHFKQDVVTDTFVKDTEDMFNQVRQGYRVICQHLMLEGSEWHFDNQLNELDHRLRERIQLEKEKQLAKLFEISKENLFDELEKIVITPIENLEDEFWSKINSNYVKTLKAHESTIKDILVDGFLVNEDEYDLTIAKFEDEVYKNSKKLIIKTSNQLGSHLNRKFNSYFKKDDKGKNRSWKDISEEKIKELHDECFHQFDKVYDNFVYIELPHRATLDTPMMSGSIARKKDTLLSPEDITKIKDKFEDDCEHALEEAMRLHHNIFGGGIPIYFWAIFVFFAYDDIFRWLSSPIFFYPLLFVATFAGLLQSLGLLMPIIQAARVAIRLGYYQIVNAK